ncbi:MAG: molybdopterin biosynthesis protein [Anaerolineales bacterium]|nr:molybdopterin biosynthesis protein [Anaerolineales bacterium]MDW8446300.1 molybdopterin biosynthesis protein [Anaerolineales bacterium]
MSVYLQDIPLDEAQAKLWEELSRYGWEGLLGKEQIPVDENALERVLAEPVWAAISSPHYHGAAMDGFAVSAESTSGATVTEPIELRVGEQAVYVDTGDPIPLWADAVIPIESVEPLSESGSVAADLRHPTRIRIRAAAVPWQHVRPMGEDIVATQLVLPSGQTLRPVDLGAIAASGQTRIWVARKPRVAIIPTGDELVPIGEPLEAGKIIEFNSIVLAAQIRSYGGEATRFPIVKDRLESIREAIARAAQTHDLVLVNAGSSAGSEDYTARAIESLGYVFVHGVAVRPGHPVVLGMVQRSAEEQSQRSHVLVVGVPGYPVSAALTNDIFVRPILEHWLGKPQSSYPTLQAVITKKITSPAGDDDYVRVVVGKVGERVCAAPLARGAGVITSLVQADGIVVVPRGIQGLEAGERVTVRLYRPLEEIERTILAIGSHDVGLDVLAQFVARRQRRLVSANVGSLGGLIALRRGEAHFAGAHLLHPESGVYNLPYIRQYLPGQAVVVLGFVNRLQGLIVPKGNPQGVRSLADLTREEVRFVNRQSGAGTRILLDYHLRQLGIDPHQIRGYENQEFTHLAVAAAVASGRATCGLGIAAAAQALDLDFIPLFSEEYHLVFPQQFYEDALLAPLLEVLYDSRFRETIQTLPGYDVEPMGKLIARLGAGGN